MTNTPNNQRAVVTDVQVEPGEQPQPVAPQPAQPGQEPEGEPGRREDEGDDDGRPPRRAG